MIEQLLWFTGGIVFILISTLPMEEKKRLAMDNKIKSMQEEIKNLNQESKWKSEILDEFGFDFVKKAI